LIVCCFAVAKVQLFPETIDNPVDLEIPEALEQEKGTGDCGR